MYIVVQCLSNKQFSLFIVLLIVFFTNSERINEIVVNKESTRYFLMSRIYPPIHSSLIRLSQTNNNNNELICEKELIGELGIFGSLISQNGKIIYERVGGSLLRSKPSTNIEGGIASGQGYIDSILLV